MDASFLPRAFLIIIIIIPATNWVSSFASAATASSSASTADGAALSKAMVAWKVNFSSWVGGDPCQHWQGVTCNDNGRVISLNLSKTGLVGPIPQEISNLQYLITLDLSNPRNANPPLNQITGDLSALEGLTNLQSLNLSFNNIQLDAFPSVVFNLTNLIALRVDNNYLNGALPKELAQLTKLEFLYLGNNSLSGPIPSEFGNLVNLRELSLWNNNLNSKIPPELGNLINLTYLNLHSCNLYGGLPSELGNLTNIQNMPEMKKMQAAHMSKKCNGPIQWLTHYAQGAPLGWKVRRARANNAKLRSRVLSSWSLQRGKWLAFQCSQRLFVILTNAKAPP